jgi:DNA-binding FadR family transcriptional regulator
LRTAPPRSAAARQAHSAFHRAVAHASHNLFLARMVDSLVDSLADSEPRPTDPTEDMADTPLLPLGYEAHARIYRPIRDHRASAARRAMHEHLSTTIHHHPGLDH